MKIVKNGSQCVVIKTMVDFQYNIFVKSIISTLTKQRIIKI